MEGVYKPEQESLDLSQIYRENVSEKLSGQEKRTHISVSNTIRIEHQLGFHQQTIRHANLVEKHKR